jgi:cholesterol oxidase
VFNYPGLFVLDGAILPEATGVNPSHTIAAVAERNVERLIRTVRNDPAWKAPERALAKPVVDPLSSVVIPEGGTAPFRSPAVGLSFTETMKGFVAPPLPQDLVELPALSDYVAAEQRAQAGGRDAQFRLTITFPNIDAFLADPAHGGSAVGTLKVKGLTPPDGAPVTAGAFNLFTTSDEFYERQMLYALPFMSAENRPYFFEGFKEVKDHGNFDLWGSTTTLYARIREGASKDGPVVGIGVLHILVPDFLRQLTTFRVHGTEDPRRKADAVTRFGRMFLGSLWDVFVRMRLQ